MMSRYVIMTEDFADLPLSYLSKHQVDVLFTTYEVDEILYSNNPDADNYLSVTDFYKKLRNGGSPKTSALSMDAIVTGMEKHLKEGKDILYLSFSSGLSGTFNNARLAAEELAPNYPDRKIVVIDTLAASLGFGLMVHRAVTLRDSGKTLEEAAAYLEKHVQNFCHYFTVDDLNFLHRGGRVSKTTAIIGSALGIKPILHVDPNGKLINIGKVRGRKQSLEMLVKKMHTKFIASENNIVFISHGDCEEDAKYVANLVRKQFDIEAFIINHVGATIGAHSGPGTLALFFFGRDRVEQA